MIDHYYFNSGSPDAIPACVCSYATAADLITRSEFLAKAPEIKVQIADASFTIQPKKFSTDSCGW